MDDLWDGALFGEDGSDLSRWMSMLGDGQAEGMPVQPKCSAGGAVKGSAWRDPVIVCNPCHNLHNGPPKLLSTFDSFGLSLRKELLPPEQCEETAHPQPAVMVDWGDLALVVEHHVYVLELRRGGRVIATKSGMRGEPLRLELPSHVDGLHCGIPYVAQLRWPTGHRHIHLLPALPSRLDVSGVMLPPPPSSPMDINALLRSMIDDSEALPKLPTPALAPDRAFGVEVEFLTEEYGASGIESKFGQIRAALATQLAAATAALEEESDLGTSECRAAQLARLVAALRACLEWKGALDSQIEPAARPLAARIVDTLDITDDSTRLRCEEIASGEASDLLKLECSSPPPPRALRFRSGGADVLSCFLHGGLASVGACASPARRDGYSGTHLHVHVNVRNPLAGGTLLTAEQIYRVFFWWVRFDLVTARFARPWLWRDHSTAPLYATGAEFEYHEALWEQGRGGPPSTHWAHVVEASPTLRARRQDLPTFVHTAHAVVREEGYDSLPEAAKVSRLAEAASSMGRYCSLNVAPLAKESYGTLEFRRFHGTMDARLLARWAHFCVAFVECFAEMDWPLLERPGTSADEVLAELSSAQEAATADELMQCMASHLDPGTATYFEEQALYGRSASQGDHADGGLRSPHSDARLLNMGTRLVVATGTDESGSLAEYGCE